MSRNIFSELFCPEILSTLWDIGIFAAGVSVPKTAMNENCSVVFWQNDIWFTRQVLHVQPEPVAHCMNLRTNNQFRLRVFGVDPRHVPASFFFSYPVHVPLLPIPVDYSFARLSSSMTYPSYLLRNIFELDPPVGEIPLLFPREQPETQP
jgi:hypothetical protein